MIDKLLKNPINKFLLWLTMGILVCIIGISNVFADEITFKVYDYQVYYDNFGSSVSQVGQTYNYSFNAYVSNNITTSANSYGAGVVINSGIPIISGHAYSLSFYFIEKGNIALSSKNRIALGSSVSSASSSYTSGSYYATMITSKVVNGSTLQFAFTANASYQYIFIPWTTTSTVTQNYVFDSYLINDLGVSSTLSQSDINNSLSSQTNTLNQSITNSQNAIIQNNNDNTQAIIDSNRVCTQYDKNAIELDNQYLDDTGGVNNLNGYGISSFIPINKNGSLKVLNARSDSAAFCFYDVNKTIISCYLDNTVSSGDDISIPNDASFFRFSILKVQNKPTYEYCANGSQVISDGINDLNDSINNDNVDENGIASAFDSFNNYLDDNSTITQLITLPVTLYTAILNNLNGTCQPFNLGRLYGSDLILPCINISQYLGNALWSMIDIIISGFAIYAISKKMIKVFNNFSSLREGDVIDD